MAINGFSTCTASMLGVFRVPGTKRSLQIRREIAPLLVGFAAEFHRLVQPIDTGTMDDWGYACRRVRGRATISFHSAGLAIDLNATRHPLGRRGTFTAKQRSIILALCRKYGLRWGGTYKNRADEMHFEVIQSRGVALSMVKRLQIAPVKTVGTVVKPTTVSGAFPLSKGAAFGPQARYYSGSENQAARKGVMQIERSLNKAMKTNFAANGIYDKSTWTWVKLFQKKYGLEQDGLVGPKTWAALGKYS